MRAAARSKSSSREAAVDRVSPSFSQILSGSSPIAASTESVTIDAAGFRSSVRVYDYFRRFSISQSST